jgi:hypothetical protein
MSQKGKGRFQLKEGADIPKTSAQLRKLMDEGKVSYKVNKAIDRLKSPREVSDYLSNKLKADIKAKTGLYGIKQSKNVIAIMTALNSCGIPCIGEHVFDSKRKFKFDIAILPIENKIAIEYEGLFSEKSRHTSLTGYPRDCEKYRLAVINGWRVLRYTAFCLKGRNGEYRAVEDVKKILKGNQ